MGCISAIVCHGVSALIKKTAAKISLKKNI